MPKVGTTTLRHASPRCATLCSLAQVNSKILAMSWTNDGLHIALGLFSGASARRGQSGERERSERCSEGFAKPSSRTTVLVLVSKLLRILVCRSDLLHVGLLSPGSHPWLDIVGEALWALNMVSLPALPASYVRPEAPFLFLCSCLGC